MPAFPAFLIIHLTSTGSSRAPELWPVLETGERRAADGVVCRHHADRSSPSSECSLNDPSRSPRRYPIDGLFLDFVRWPLHWEIELRPGRTAPPDSSFDPVTLGGSLKKTTGIADPAALASPSIGARLDSRASSCRMGRLQMQVVTDFVGEARGCSEGGETGCRAGAFLVPDVDGSDRGAYRPASHSTSLPSSD